MVFLIILLIILFFGLSWILFSPIQITLNSQKKIYQIHWYGIARARLLLLSKDFLIRVNVFFWEKDFSLLRPKKEKKKATKKKRKFRSRKKTLKKIIRILKSFKIKIFKIDLDTGDYIQNSYLYPVFHFLKNKKRDLSINYRGDVNIHLKIENRLYKILLSLLFP